MTIDCPYCGQPVESDDDHRISIHWPVGATERDDPCGYSDRIINASQLSVSSIFDKV